jgi:hypothetical protein
VTTARDQAGRDQAGRDQTGRDQMDRDPTGRDRTGRDRTGHDERSPAEIAAEIAVLHAHIEAGVAELRRRARRLAGRPRPRRVLDLLRGVARWLRAPGGLRRSGGSRRARGL